MVLIANTQISFKYIAYQKVMEWAIVIVLLPKVIMIKNNCQRLFDR